MYCIYDYSYRTLEQYRPVDEAAERAPVGGRVRTLVLREHPQLVRAPTARHVMY